MSLCSKCNKEIDDNTELCDDCSKAVIESEADKKEVSKKKSLLTSVLIGVGTLILAVIASVFFLVNKKQEKTDGKSIKNFAYIKDNKLFISNLSNKKPINIDWNIENKYEEEDSPSRIYGIEGIIRFSKDERLIFYPYETKETTYTLYYKDISKPNKKPVMIDEGISKEFHYSVSDDNVVTYVKKSGNTIYQYDVEKNKKEKIDSKIKDSISLYMNDAGGQILYLKEDGELYFKEKGKDKEKLSSGVFEIDSYMYMEGKGYSVLYLKDDKVYKKEVDKEEVELSQEVGGIVRPGDEDKFYYTKNIDSSADTLMDYVEDDMKEQDEAMEKPYISLNYPYQSEYSSKEEYQAALDAYNLAKEEYSKAEDEYEEKEKRDMLRQELSMETLPQSGKELYYFDKKESHKLSDKFIRIESESSVLDEPVMVIIQKADEDSKKVKLSELRDKYDAYNKLGYDLSEKGERVIVVGSKIFNVEKEGATSFRVSSNGDTIYFMADIDEGEKTGIIYEIKVKDGSISTPQVYDEEVYSEYLSIYDDKLMYFKNTTDNPNRRSGDYEANLGTLYIDKNKIDEKVYTREMAYNILNSGSKDILYYYTYYDITKSEGELKVYDGNQPKSVKEAVHDFVKLEDDSVLYLRDYNNDKHKGTLSLYKDGESKDIDEEVMMIIKNAYIIR